LPTFHPVAELAQLLEIRRREGRPQDFDLFAAIAHEYRDQVLEVFCDRDVMLPFVHVSHYRRRPPVAARRTAVPLSGFVSQVL
jgi:hypothetical protein